MELPTNIDAERGLIGLTLADKRIPAGAKDVAATDFADAFYRPAWRAFLELEVDGREIEPFSAYEIIKRDLPSISNRYKLSDLSNTVIGIPSGYNERVLVKKLKDASLRRFLIGELQGGIESLKKGGPDAIKNLKRQLEDLDGISEARGNFRHISEIIEKEVKPGILDLQHGITRKISTGFPSIDKLIGGGVSESDVLLFAGLPGSGKSAFVLQLAVNIARQEIPVAFVSGEMSDRENGNRLVSQASKTLNLNSQTHLPDTEAQFLTEWAEACAQLPIYMDSKTSDLLSISRSLRSLVEESGVKVLVIDYIQLMKMSRHDRTKRYERITEASQEVKRIAQEYGIAIIEVAQFNREGAKGGKPMMHDLEGSSQLEKDASLIFIMDREEDHFINVRIVKGRNSGLSEFAGRFTGWNLNFEF